MPAAHSALGIMRPPAAARDDRPDRPVAGHSRLAGRFKSTGTGLLAYAGLALWPEAYALATDIDPVAIEVAEDNALVNGVALGREPGQCALIVADGTRHPLIAEMMPFDLVIANILAGPLIDMAADITGLLASGRLVGGPGFRPRLTMSSPMVPGLKLTDRINRGDWAILQMVVA